MKHYFTVFSTMQKEYTNLVIMFRYVYLCVHVCIHMCNQIHATIHHGRFTLLYQFGDYGFYHSQSDMEVVLKMLQQQ
uniref:Uncharacterized protein n=1 Tax=Macaca fascicularis TaxID=9541 RepID=Q9GM36_MACFA|nr:hypothetical protein [Macaca fascicularis]